MRDDVSSGRRSGASGRGDAPRTHQDERSGQLAGPRNVWPGDRLIESPPADANGSSHRVVAKGCLAAEPSLTNTKSTMEPSTPTPSPPPPRHHRTENTRLAPALAQRRAPTPILEGCTGPRSSAGTLSAGARDRWLPADVTPGRSTDDSRRASQSRDHSRIKHRSLPAARPITPVRRLHHAITPGSCAGSLLTSGR